MKATRVLLGVLAVVAIVGVTLLRSDDPDLATEAPPIPTAASGSRSRKRATVIGPPSSRPRRPTTGPAGWKSRQTASATS